MKRAVLAALIITAVGVGAVKSAPPEQADFTLPAMVEFFAPDGRSVKIDFGGDALKITGDMPVEEAAKLFFDFVFGHYKDCIDAEKVH